MSSISQTDLANLDDGSKKEIMNFLESENSKQKVQMSIHQFTNLCFKNCITNVHNADLSSQEEQCLNNCVNRFLDTNIRIVKGLQSIQ
ncbi:Mitochondrial import inner membrane translocase subunit TIM8 [Kluyveromyces marxianus]|uniref:Mitochondrial import inner membrane translocase subunit n=2 Tax=Kluyveromyces marxianus TaxID=4911 RepID=W0TA64_KLUMD|nr:mitochondrial import inner membrane translocase subunit TIM8 [Kluyveromyces marxianus DMKU3-1042]KAG0678207.1 Mitochondrial import inner membrane translocase subunit tim8 [Kluyveromyces marxianus]KAG0684810.1 Mitochondrial import inner membrane translocase subunit tim8 [Kluyveromyces marxianus]QGN16250.1 mitochondrial import inner membrane translocase subunit TIM8 [Kluyveromyces marxianus]BAO40522.1 mitochondrial import inner membrane translocase subunit TIM8 [Kluyveromyces marxianus DMKU3-1